MRLFLTAIIIAILSFLAQGLGPWWSGAVIVLVVVLVMKLKPLPGLAAGFIGLFLAWGVTAGWVDFQNHGLLSTRIGGLFGSLPSLAIVVLTGLVGGLVGAMVGLTAGFITRWPRSRSTVTKSAPPT